jgi:hypothetical protein
VVFFNANMQKYEEWLFYFHRYAKDAQVGMLVFNWRGVGYSDGCAVSVADLVVDGTAALQYVRALGVAPGHVLVHGLSIGACVAALVRARQPVAEHGPVVIDRGFSTLSAVLQGYAEFAMRRGEREGEGWRSGCARGLRRAVLEAMALVVWLILLATGWEVRADADAYADADAHTRRQRRRRRRRLRGGGDRALRDSGSERESARGGCTATSSAPVSRIGRARASSDCVRAPASARSRSRLTSGARLLCALGLASAAATARPPHPTPLASPPRGSTAARRGTRCPALKSCMRLAS